jgi:aryl-alcohol dehydrogenase-like predicted oxidoreductase
MTNPNFTVLERLESWCRERDRGLNELAEAWLLARPQVCSVISGATKVEQVLSNAQAADWALDETEVAQVAELLGT